MNVYFLFFVQTASKDDEIEESISADNENQSCTFGNLILKLGDRLKSSEDDECLSCMCSIPPYITCIKSC